MNKMKELREVSGLTQKEFSEKFRIPKRSLENWEYGKSDPSPYIPYMIATILAQEKALEVMKDVMKDAVKAGEEENG